MPPTLARVGAAAVAVGFATAYLGSPPGEAPELRRRRCRAFDTDQLDQRLGAPTWSGAGGSPAPGRTVEVTVTSLNATDGTIDAVGYEMAATVTVVVGGRPMSRDQHGLELWLVAGAGGRWRVDQLR